MHFDVYPYVASSSVLLMHFVRAAERVRLTWSEPHPDMSGLYLDEICDQAAALGITVETNNHIN